MAVASWMISGRSLRNGRNNRSRLAAEEDLYKLDPVKSHKQNTCDILRGLCCRSGVYYDVVPPKSPSSSPTATDEAGMARALSKTIISDAKRLSYLNALVKLLSKDESRQKLGFTTEELLCCLRISLVHESTQVRAGTLRAVRYVLRCEADVVAFNSLRLPYLVTRCMDVVLRNEMERVQALRVVRRALRLGAGRLEAALARALLAVPAAAPEDKDKDRLMRACLAVPAAAPEYKDRLMRACLAVLCELGVLNPMLFIETGGVAAITWAILDCQTPRIAESLCGVLLHLLNQPATRLPAKVDLRCLAAPYCDFHYRHGWMDKNRDEREMRFTCSRLSLLSVLRSWPGFLHFCDPMNESGLRAIVDVLYLNQLEVRKAILDLLYELLSLPQPDWTDELSVALAAVDPSDFQDQWRLNEGFVAAEGKSILPHLAATGPNLIELHMALLLYCFLEVGLLDALVEVVVTSDTFISVRATVLLGQLLHLIHLLLPPDTCNISPPLPTLLAHAAAAHPQALAAVSALQNLNTLLKSRPASNSLFLDHVIQCCDTSPEEPIAKAASPKVKVETAKSVYKYPEDSTDLLNDADFELEQPHRRSLGSKSEYNTNEGVLVKSKSVSARTSAVVSKVVKTKKIFNLFENLKDSDNLIRESNVLQNKAGFAWDWNIIRAILKTGTWGVEQALLVRRLVHYLCPSSNRFSHTDLLQAGPLHTRDQAQAALYLVTYLLQLQQSEGLRLLEELFLDIATQVEAISGARSAHECLFSPQHMTTTMCQLYFLLIGRLCSTRVGLRMFRDTGLYESLLRLATTTHHSCYVKLIISGLDYTLNSYPRQILFKTLQCNMESSRLYATQFLNVLLRARQKASEINNKHNGPRRRSNIDVEPPTPSGTDMDMSRSWSSSCSAEVCSDMDGWILELLVKQARDESKAVSICALDILDEACNVPVYLNKLVSMKPRVKDLGDKGYLLWIRFAGTQAGFQALTEAGYVRRQIRYWVEHYNYRYTRLVEGEIHECLTLLQRAEDGRYRRRVSTGPAPPRQHTPPPPHLYAQLALHHNGRDMLARHGDLAVLTKCVKQGLCSNDQEVMDLKSAMWACGHTATSSTGIELLTSLGKIDSNVFADTVKLVQNCPVYSIRGTAFYVLGLMACTYEGAKVLHGLGWLCVRHNRHERWPIIQQETWLTKTASEDQMYPNIFKGSVPREHRKTVDTETSENSDKTEHSAAESCHSENTKGKSMVTSATMEQSLTEESCDSCDGDILDDKLHLDKSNIRSVSESSDRPEKRHKCQTLPQRLYPGARKHQRSLSESKTVDKLKADGDSTENVYERSFYIGPISENRPMIGRLNSFDVWNEGVLRRIRNTSESSTSGVSSCDSVLGKYVYNDRILTLSPIPSSSSLSAVKSIISNKRQTEATRRISLHSYTGSDVASSPPSQRDLVGYATLRTLSRHRRPTYSETTDELSSFLNSETKKVPTFSSLKGKSKLAEARSTRMSIFKYDWKPIGNTSESRNSLAPLARGEGDTPRVSPVVTEPPLRGRPATPRGQVGPTYMGISMPRCLKDIFPSRGQHHPPSAPCQNYPRADDYMTADDILGAHCEHALRDTGTKKNDDSNFNSSFSDLSMGGNGMKSSSRMTRGRSRDRFSKHDQLSCLCCSRLRPAPDAKKTSDLREAFFAGMESPKPSGSGSGTLGKSPGPTSTSLEPSVSCGSPTSLDSNLSRMSDGNPNVPGEILKHAERMGNPYWHKQSRQVLLGLKQKYPEVFQNVCLYSEICKLVSQSTYRLSARRFLQELFLDLSFDVFYQEPQQIIQNKMAELVGTQ